MANRYYPPIIWHSLIVQWFVCRQLPTITSLWFWELESSQLLEAPGPRIADVYHLKLQWNSLSNGVLAVTVQSRFGVFALPLSFRWQRTCEVLSCEQWRRSHWKTTGSLMLWLELIFAITLAEVMKIAATRVARAQDLQLTEIYVCGVFVPNVFPCMSFLACAQRVYQSIKLRTCLPVGPFGFANLNVDHGFHPIARSLAHSVVWAGWSAQLFRRSTPDQGRDCGTALRRTGRGPIIDQRLRLSNHSDSPCPFGKGGGKMWKVAWKYHKS